MEEAVEKRFHVCYDHSIRAVVMEWSGYFTSAQFRAHTLEMFETLKQHGCTRVLALVREMLIIGMEDREWLLNSFLPRAIAAGFTRCAILAPRHHFNRVAIEEILRHADRSRLTTALFETEDEARRWLKTP